eukprot:Tamp_10813.p1 GENE.Tamp_10813~~Tamp_10813.p1  ORF type:complete len:289 (-),score=53.55 Tamp_10813:132-998(-)
MQKDAETADLVIVLGTSLGGLNADQVATTAAARSLQGDALGTVCINLQQTPQDGKMTLRIFGKSDDVLLQLMAELGLAQRLRGCLRAPPMLWPADSRVAVPYDKEGRLIRRESDKDKPRKMMWLDLRGGQAIKLCAGHNIQGARQPAYMHIGACKPVSVGKGPARAPGPGHGRVIKRNEITCSFVLSIQDAEMHLGLWWLDVAVRGAVPQLPIVNLEPQFCTEAEAAAIAAAPKPRPASGAPRCSAKPPRVHADQLAPRLRAESTWVAGAPECRHTRAVQLVQRACGV